MRLCTNIAHNVNGNVQKIATCGRICRDAKIFFGNWWASFWTSEEVPLPCLLLLFCDHCKYSLALHCNNVTRIDRWALSLDEKWKGEKIKKVNLSCVIALEYRCFVNVLYLFTHFSHRPLHTKVLAFSQQLLSIRVLHMSRFWSTQTMAT